MQSLYSSAGNDNIFHRVLFCFTGDRRGGAAGRGAWAAGAGAGAGAAGSGLPRVGLKHQVQQVDSGVFKFLLADDALTRPACRII